MNMLYMVFDDYVGDDFVKRASTDALISSELKL